MNQDHDKKMQGQGKQSDMNERHGQGKPQQGGTLASIHEHLLEAAKQG